MADYNYEVDIVVDGALQALKELNDTLTANQTRSRGHATQMRKFGQAYDKIAQTWENVSDEAGKYRSRIESLLSTETTLTGKTKLMDQIVKTMANSMRQGTSSAKALETALKKYEKLSTAKQLEAAADAQARLNAEQLKQNQIAKKAGLPIPYPDAGKSPEEIAAKKRADLLKEEAQQERVLLEIAKAKQDLIDQLSRKVEVNSKKSLAQYERDEKQKTKILEGELEEQLQKVTKFYLQRNKLVTQPQTPQQIKSMSLDKLLDIAEGRELAAAAKADPQTYKEISSHISKIESDFEKAKSEQNEMLKTAEEFERVQKQIVERKKEEDRIVKAAFQYIRDKKKEQEQELRLAKEYLNVQAQIKAGTLDPKSIQRMSPDQISRLERGRQVYDKTQQDPKRYAELSKSISEYQQSLDLAKLAQSRFASEAAATYSPMEKLDQKVKEVTLSWKSMGRIIVARAITQAFFQIQNAIRQSTIDARELFNAVAEIQTITERTSQGALQYATTLQRIVDISNQINFTPQDTANAFYETLSNQIGQNVSQISAFITEAGKLGKVTRASLQDSADALSSVINAYNLPVSEAAEISAKLFVLVDQGRLRLEEVANTMGNVAVPASQLGVGFDSIVGGLSAISIAGVPARESMTLFRNIMFKLIRPTEKMTELFQSWGVASGQAAIATFGFEGVLARLQVEADKGAEEIGELFSTIRAVRGVLGLTEQNFEKYTNAVIASKKAQEDYNEIVEDYLANPGEKFNRLIQQTSNQILELGLRLVKYVSNLNDFFGTTQEGNFRLAEFIGFLAKMTIAGAVGAGTFAILTTAAGLLAPALSAVGVSALSASVSFGLLSKAAAVLSLNPTVLAFTALAGVITAAIFSLASFRKSYEETLAVIGSAAQEKYKNLGAEQFNKLTEAVTGTYKVFDQKLKKALEESSNRFQTLQEEINKLRKSGDLETVADELERMQKALTGSASDQKIAKYFGDQAEFARAFATNIQDATEELTEHNKGLEDQEQQIQKVIDKLKQQRKASLDLVKSNRLNLMTSITERNLSGLQGPALANAQYSVAQDLANRAFNSKDANESRELFDLARKFLADAESTAFETGALGSLERHIAFFNAQEAELYALQERREALQTRQIENRGASLQQQQQEIQRQKEIIDIELQRRELLASYYETRLALTNEYLRLVKEIQDNETLTDEERAKALEDLNKKYQQAIDNEKQLAKAKGIDTGPIDERLDTARQNQAAIEDAIRRQNILKQEQTIILEGAEDFKVGAAQLNKASEELENTAKQITSTMETFVRAVDESRLKFQPFGPNGPQVDFNFFQRESIDALLEKLEELKNSSLTPSELATEIAKLAPKIAQLDPGNETLAEIQRNITNSTSNLLTQAVTLNQAIEGFGVYTRESSEKLAEFITLMQKLVTEVSPTISEANRVVNGLTTAVRALGFITEQQAQKYQSDLDSFRNAPGMAKGGPVGTDTIPAWLSPGEYVVNARAARNNFSWLQAINFRGARRFANGGSVTNHQSFSNTFNMSSTNPNAQASMIVNVVKRQLSQGKATLSKGRPY